MRVVERRSGKVATLRDQPVKSSEAPRLISARRPGGSTRREPGKAPGVQVPVAGRWRAPTDADLLELEARPATSQCRGLWPGKIFPFTI